MTDSSVNISNLVKEDSFTSTKLWDVYYHCFVTNWPSYSICVPLRLRSRFLFVIFHIGYLIRRGAEIYVNIAIKGVLPVKSGS